MEFQINDRVRVKENLSIQYKNSKCAMNAGMSGVITDKCYSEALQQPIYFIKFDGRNNVSTCKFTADDIEKLPEEPSAVAPEAEYTFKIDHADNIVIAIMYIDGKEIARAHGHIIHQNEIGVAQAASYALKLIYRHLKGDI